MPLTQPLRMPICVSVTWKDCMEQSSSFLEEGRAWRDEKQELVSRKEMDNVPESRLSGVLNLESLTWAPHWAFGGS